MLKQKLGWPVKCLKFGALWVRSRIGQHHQNALVRAHVRLTPTISTPNIISDIALEQVGLWQRRGALRQHSLNERMRVLGEEIALGTNTTPDRSAHRADTPDTGAGRPAGRPATRPDTRPDKRPATTHA